MVARVLSFEKEYVGTELQELWSGEIKAKLN